MHGKNNRGTGFEDGICVARMNGMQSVSLASAVVCIAVATVFLVFPCCTSNFLNVNLNTTQGQRDAASLLTLDQASRNGINFILVV